MVSTNISSIMLLSSYVLANTLVIKDNTVESFNSLEKSPIVVREEFFEVDLSENSSSAAKTAIEGEIFNYFRVKSEYDSFMSKVEEKLDTITTASFYKDLDLFENGTVFNRNFQLISNVNLAFNYSLITEKSNSFSELLKIVGDIAKKIDASHSKLFIRSAFVSKSINALSVLSQKPEAVLPFTSYANIYVDLLSALAGPSSSDDISYILQVLIRIEEQNKKVLSLYNSLTKEGDVYLESDVNDLLENVRLISRLCTILKSTSLNVLQNVSVDSKGYPVLQNAINLMNYFVNLCNFTNCTIPYLINTPIDTDDLSDVSKVSNVLCELYKNNLFFIIRKNRLSQFIDFISHPYSWIENLKMFIKKFFFSPKFTESDVFLNSTGRYNDVYSQQLSNFSSDSILSFVEEFETAYSEDLKRSMNKGEIDQLFADLPSQISEVEYKFNQSNDVTPDNNSPKKQTFARTALKTTAGILLVAIACFFVVLYYKTSKKVEAVSIN